jgi:hypothetical protein
MNLLWRFVDVIRINSIDMNALTGKVRIECFDRSFMLFPQGKYVNRIRVKCFIHSHFSRRESISIEKCSRTPDQNHVEVSPLF